MAPIVRASSMLILVASFGACKGGNKTDLVASASAAAEAPKATASATPAPEPKTPAELLDEHRERLAKFANNGMYHEVCGGVPWFNQTICKWAAARAEGKQVERVDGDLFKSYFIKEHWKHAYGRIVARASEDSDYEVTAGGYRSHVILHTDGTEYTTTGGFDLWVQEQPDTLDVPSKTGAAQSYIVLLEVPLAKALMDLAHAGGGLEATALAKNAVGMIALYKTYAERKDGADVPAVPAPGWAMDKPVAAAPEATTATTAPIPAPPPPETKTVTAAPARAEVAAKSRVVVPDPPAPPVIAPSSVPVVSDQARRQARSACLSKCIAGCSDDANCERGCATTTCSSP